MYCSTCGVVVTKGLSYCKNCGAKFTGTDSSPSESPAVRPELVICAMAFTFILGLAAIGFLIGILSQVAAFDMGVMLAITMFSFMLMVAIEVVFILLLRRGWKRTTEKARSEKEHKTKELGEAQARMLPEPVPSVTENTTRAFEPIYTEPKARS